MEARRKAEEAERKKQEEAERIAALALQQQLEKAAQDDKQNREKLEQERRDHEIASRLAKETNETVEGSPPELRRSEKFRLQQALIEKQKYDLSKWKYSELRDSINTLCDIELLEACRHEIHRRLKVYHAWKAKNQRRTTMAETERAPKSIMDAAANSPRHQPKSEILSNVDRYFRISFVRPGHTEDRKGWWYAHFHGQYVARQMELHPDKSPVLLLAGVDDMQMCEFSLDETGLARKRGAEILECEFLAEWKKNGGPETHDAHMEACCHEFHWCVKVCRACKAKNQRTTMAETERAHKSIMDAAANSPRHQPKSEILSNVDRYFRIPFVRPGHAEDRKVWCYAHFHGQYVARQMELHPDKSPVLLVAGVDDMQMCELSLDETGLARKRGAEILEHEFLTDWKKNGGGDYISPAERAK